MKQIFFITIVVLLLLAGCSNTSNNSNNNKNTSVTNEQTETSQPEKLFPASYSIKVVTQDYHLNMRPLSNKAIMRVTKDMLINVATNKEFYPYFRKIEIINDGNVIYQDGISIESYQDPAAELADCGVEKGKDMDYFTYSLDSSAGSPEHSLRYQVLRFIKENNTYKVIKFKESLPSLIESSAVFSSDNNEVPSYDLEDGKYTIVQYNDEKLVIESKLEFTNDSLKEVDKDFRIIHAYNMDMTLIYDNNARKEAKSIEIYPTYTLEDKAQTIPISEKSNVIILGGRHIYGNIYTLSETSIHIIIDKHEGWITIQDYTEKLGF